MNDMILTNLETFIKPTLTPKSCPPASIQMVMQGCKNIILFTQRVISNKYYKKAPYAIQASLDKNELIKNISKEASELFNGVLTQFILQLKKRLERTENEALEQIFSSSKGTANYLLPIMIIACKVHIDGWTLTVDNRDFITFFKNEGMVDITENGAANEKAYSLQIQRLEIAFLKAIDYQVAITDNVEVEQLQEILAIKEASPDYFIKSISSQSEISDYMEAFRLTSLEEASWQYLAQKLEMNFFDFFYFYNGFSEQLMQALINVEIVRSLSKKVTIAQLKEYFNGCVDGYDFCNISYALLAWLYHAESIDSSLAIHILSNEIVELLKVIPTFITEFNVLSAENYRQILQLTGVNLPGSLNPQGFFSNTPLQSANNRSNLSDTTTSISLCRRKTYA